MKKLFLGLLLLPIIAGAAVYSHFSALSLDADGSASAPALAFSSDADTGIYRVSANTIAIACGGSGTLVVNAGGLNGVLGATTPAAAAVTTLTASGLATLNGSVKLGDAGADTITVTGAPVVDKSSPSLHSAVDAVWVDGKTSTDVWTANYHPVAGIRQAWAVLAEAPDPASNYTLKITDGTHDITDTITFIATDPVGMPAVFTIDLDYDNIAKTESVAVVSDGTTTTLGKAIVYFTYVGE